MCFGINSCTMLLRGIFLLGLVALTPSVHSEPNEDEIVFGCELESQIFTANEYKYCTREYKDFEDPQIPADPVEELVERAYSLEIRQRPFECISNCIDDENATQRILMNPNYQALACKCRAQQSHPQCDPSYKYRTINGTCNNLMHPKWGSIFSCFRRYILPSYEGVSGFRQSVCGQPLPHPRNVSLNIHPDQTRLNNDITHMCIFFGQIIAHDLTDTPTSTIGDKFLDCCSHPGVNQHPQCAPILISPDDPFYSKFGFRCFNFMRATPCDSCGIGKRNQMNQVTSYLDLSFVYGSTENTIRNLRKYGGTGELKSQWVGGEELLAPDYSVKPKCGTPDKTELCFTAGDHRVNQQSVLMSMQTLYQREHNRLAKEFRQLNPHWDEETLFQESRKVNIAQFQAIIYKDFLPLILGDDLMTSHDLWINDTKRSTYDPNVDATLWASFSTAAFRLHSVLNGVVSEFICPREKRLLRFLFNAADPLYSGNMSSLLEGISLSHAQIYDRFMTTDMTNFLYRNITGSYGLDIVSLNLQRGRDNGLPSYTKMLRFLSQGSINIQCFEDLEYIMDKENIEALRNIYCSVEDIDLWAGINNEKVKKNMVVGPTAGKLIASQFSDLKRGDRFYFEHEHEDLVYFNDEQLATLRRSSHSCVMCENLNIQMMQKNALQYPNEENPILPCEKIPKLDLTLWKDNQRYLNKK